MDLNSIRLTARERFNGACRVCRVCNGVVCAGEMPGMGGRGTGAAFRNNVEALARCRLNLRTIHSVSQPNLACRIFGLELAMPIIGAPIAGTHINMNGAMTEETYAAAVATGCARAGTVAMTGDGSHPEEFECSLKAIRAVGGRGIAIIKPRAVDKVIEMAKQAVEAGAPAFGMDIDAAVNPAMASAGYPVGPKTLADLVRIRESTPLPFIVKGIMTGDEAEICLAAGAAAIVVSNHGGRVLDNTPGTAEVLPAITAAVKGKLTILVDGGIRSGTDVLKMLALGADAVLVGRPLAVAAVGGGAEGVELALKGMAAELKAAMVQTGTADVTRVDARIIC